MLDALLALLDESNTEVPSTALPGEPLQATSGKEVPPVPWVPLKNPEVKGGRTIPEHQMQRLLTYLALIGETDPDIIDEVLNACGRDVQLLAGALAQADIVIRTHHGDFSGLVQCHTCQRLSGNYCASQHWFVVSESWRKCTFWRPKNV